jgi:DNA ligase-1
MAKEKTLPVLYHEGRTGKLYSWKIWTEGADIVTEYGTVDGEKSVARKTVAGKNLGKSNETTPEEQAQREAAAQHKKKLDKKYSTTKTAAKETVFLPMLAQDYLKQKKPLTYPVDVQAKLEGVRCLGFWGEDGELHLMSRGGKPFDVQHIKEQMEEALPLGLVADGELYVHGMLQQDINRLWKKHREGPEGSIQLQFRVYDCFLKTNPEMLWKDRHELLHEMLEKPFKGQSHLFVEETWVAEDEKELFSAMKHFEDEGFEGVIIRKLDGPYQLGHRSRDLLKLKSFQDAEFEIVGHEEGKGNDKGTVIWECVTPGGITFTVRPMGSREDRAAYFQFAERHYGRLLTVKFQGYTKAGKPQFGVGVAFREPEDM